METKISVDPSVTCSNSGRRRVTWFLQTLKVPIDFLLFFYVSSDRRSKYGLRVICSTNIPLTTTWKLITTTRDKEDHGSIVFSNYLVSEGTQGLHLLPALLPCLDKPLLLYIREIHYTILLAQLTINF
jgi:hypothetical protein